MVYLLSELLYNLTIIRETLYFRRLCMEAIIFMFCITLHNIEEALWLTAWMEKHMPTKRGLRNNNHFIFAVLGITILGYLTAGLFMMFPDNLYIGYAFIGFVGAMIVNTIMPHLIFTVIYKKFCPGVFTGCFLIIPFHTIILLKALSETLTLIEVLVSVIVIGLILLGSIPIFVSIAKRYL